MKAKGVIVQQIKFAPKDAVDLLENVLSQNGITIYAKIDQQEEAAKNGVKINPLMFLLFGNPAKGGLVNARKPFSRFRPATKSYCLAGRETEQLHRL